MVSIARDPASEPRSEAAHAGPPPAIPDFDIVPRVGLALAGVIIVALIVVVAIGGLWPLEFMHVVFGAGWTMIDLFLGFIIGPILGSLSIPARIEFTVRFMPKMVVLMPAIVTATLVAGWQLSTQARHESDLLPPPRLGGREHDRRRSDGDRRARAVRAGEHRGAGRAQEAAAEPAGDREADEALHLRRRGHGVMQIATFVIMTKLASS